MLPKLQLNKKNVKNVGTKYLVYNVKLMTQKHNLINKVKKIVIRYSFNCKILKFLIIFHTRCVPHSG